MFHFNTFRKRSIRLRIVLNAKFYRLCRLQTSRLIPALNLEGLCWWHLPSQTQCQTRFTYWLLPAASCWLGGMPQFWQNHVRTEVLIISIDTLHSLHCLPIYPVRWNTSKHAKHMMNIIALSWLCSSIKRGYNWSRNCCEKWWWTHVGVKARRWIIPSCVGICNFCNIYFLISCR